MKIAVWHNLPSGGGKRALYNHVQGLLTRGHTLESWCPPTADQDYLPLSNLIREHVVPAQRKPAAPTYSPENFITLRTHSQNLNRELDSYARQCAAEIERGDFDILFANSSIGIAVSSIGRYLMLPKALYLQEPFRYFYEAEPHLPWMALPAQSGWSPRQLLRSLHNSVRVRGWRVQLREEWQNARTYDEILVNSLYSRESVLRAYGLDAKVCYLGVDASKFVNRHLPREDLVVGVGSISPRKNIRFVIEALARVPSPRPRFVWVGNTVEREHQDELAALAATRNVEFITQTMVDDEVLIDLLNRARMLVYAPRLEPFGLVTLEANACGLPVVAVAEGGVRETVINGINGLLVEPEPQAMADAIHRLLNNPDHAAQLGEQGCELVAERWTAADATDRLERRLQSLL
jgi:glycosyltransferase involved in cell wall biosynthesis